MTIGSSGADEETQTINAYPAVQPADLAELAGLDDTAFRARYSGSPIKRIGRDRFVRNVLYAIGNSGAPRLREVAQGLCEDADAAVADAARWAVMRLRDAANGQDAPVANTMRAQERPDSR
mgnify:CR=1 FL=1